MWSILERGKTKILSLFWNKQSTKKNLHLFKTNKALKNRIGKAKVERDKKGEGINKLKRKEKKGNVNGCFKGINLWNIFRNIL